MRLPPKLIFFAGLLMGVSAQAIPAAQSPNSCVLPPGLQDELAKSHSGAKILALSDLSEYDKKLFQKDHGARCPGLVRVNFYGDGRPTWALVLISGVKPKKRVELVVAQKVGNGWNLRAVETTDEAAVVWREGPGKYEGVYGDKTILAAHPVIVFCGYGSWAIVYAWTGREVDKVWISD